MGWQVIDPVRPARDRGLVIDVPGRSRRGVGGHPPRVITANVRGQLWTTDTERIPPARGDGSLL